MWWFKRTVVYDEHAGDLSFCIAHENNLIRRDILGASLKLLGLLAEARLFNLQGTETDLDGQQVTSWTWDPASQELKPERTSVIYG